MISAAILPLLITVWAISIPLPKPWSTVCPGAKVSITADPAVVEDADRVVFPGVGAIRDCMGEIQRFNVGDVVSQAMKSKPVLAICVGMQALLESSEENGGVDCLGLLPGQVKFFGDNLVDEQGC